MTSVQAAAIMAIASERLPSKQQDETATVGDRVADAIGASTARISDEMIQRASALLTKEQLTVLADIRERQDAQVKLEQLVLKIESSSD
jgi:hypothetical protein